MQHGGSVPEEQDPERPLSAGGKNQIRASARALRKMGINFDLMISSPKVRSHQTAEIVAAELGYHAADIEETALAKPMTPADETVAYLKQYVHLDRLFIAGHLPSLAEIASFLLTEGSTARIAFQMGGLIRIDVDTLPTNEGTLHYCLTPEQLRIIGG